ncbi:hypothetical protein TNCV_2926561 [Trichonephila clavipes]|nr:hypothetical protein TNCV_2926561 [Trichonephila clavipes]
MIRLTFTEMDFKLGIHQTTALNYIKRLVWFQTLCFGAARIKRKKFNGQHFDTFFKAFSSQWEPFLDYSVTGDKKADNEYIHVIRKKASSCAAEQFHSDASLEAVERRAPNNSENWQWMTEDDVSARRLTPAPHGGE